MGLSDKIDKVKLELVCQIK